MIGLKTNPGGNIPPSQAVGREQLCKECWRTLEVQSLRLENERRFGKTTILRILQATAPAGTRAILKEVSGISSVSMFIEELIKDIDEAVPEKSGQFTNRMKHVLKNLSGLDVQIPGTGIGLKLPPLVKQHWRTILQQCFEDIPAVTEDRIVFFWDEVPWMVQQIKDNKDEGQTMALDLLNTLRDIRQTHDNIRMVFTGSIGFHHVMTALEEEGVAAQPVNDMKQINVPPLDRAHGMLLAERLFVGENIATEDMVNTCGALHDQTGGVPYYIHHVVADLAPGGTGNPMLVQQKIMKALTDPNDPWNMRHFNTRLKAYYGRLEEVARTVLDALAASETPLGIDDLQNAVSASGHAPAGMKLDSHAMLKLLRNMMRDHYLEQESEGLRRYTIQFPLIRRWWRIERGVE